MSTTTRVRIGLALRGRLRRRVTVGIAVVALAGGALATALPATAHPAATLAAVRAASRSEHPAAVASTKGSTVHYAVNVPTCAVPKNPDAPRCFAMKRVNVSKGTPRAYRYVTSNAITYGPKGGYTPADLAAAYGYNPKLNRQGQLVGIIDWFDDPDALKDLNTFDRTYHLPVETARSFRKVNQLGRTTPLPKPDKDSSSEIALDIESVRAVCNTCRILLVEANSGTDTNLATAENLAVRMGATEVSNSFGETEHKVPASVFNAYNHPGVVITASTGDDGWYAWDRANVRGGASSDAPEFPSSDPDVVSVGGTDLTLDTSTSKRTDETVWNENGAEDQYGVSNEGAGGGGCSHIYAAAPWQARYPGYSAAGCNGKRLAADVSAIADPAHGFDILDSYNGGWGTYGGTSLASPVTAAMYALAGGSGGAEYPAATLYTNGSYRPTSLFDVIAGGNSFCAGDTTSNCGNVVYSGTKGGTANPNDLGVGSIDCSFPRNGTTPANPPPFSSECNAVTGYDGPSGLGTPNSDALFTPTNAALTIGHTAFGIKKAVTLAAHVTQRDPDAKVTRLLWNFGDGHSLTTTNMTVHHTWARAGTYTIKLLEVDNLTQRSYATLAITLRAPKPVKKKK